MKKLKLFDEEADQPKPPKQPKCQPEQSPAEPEPERINFQKLSLEPKLVKALEAMSYTEATLIQSESLPHSLLHKDMLCLSETGSGKTLSFVIPIVNALIKNQNQGLGREQTKGFALILSPTRELSLQTKEYFDRLEENNVGGWGTTVLYGGTDPMKQVIELARQPAVIIGTPGRVLHHLQHTKGFNLNGLRFLVLDEADKLLNMDFEKQINDILELIPKERTTSLYSATLTSKVNKLQRVSLRNPVKIELSQKYQTVAKLEQHYIFIPAKHKDCYLVYLLHRMKKQITIVYAKTCMTVVRLTMLLKDLNFKATCLHGELTQASREANLLKFRSGQRNVLVSTDVSSRGIDVNDVELVVNYDVPPPKDYIHRVGRTARMGKEGLALTIVTQYDVEEYQKIESCINEKLTEYQVPEQDALVFQERVQQSQRETSKRMRQQQKKPKGEDESAL